jgi:hypothetical protein
LKIVIVEGEDAVNIVQQKTAVRSRHRGTRPERSTGRRCGRALRDPERPRQLRGARTLTVTTNAVGRAAVTSLTPTGSGALQISATAAFQGQTGGGDLRHTLYHLFPFQYVLLFSFFISAFYSLLLYLSS